MPKFFINHPVFAWVVAILISLSGVIAILDLGVESYPNIAPPQVTVGASYPGASAATVERAVTRLYPQVRFDMAGNHEAVVNMERQDLDEVLATLLDDLYRMADTHKCFLEASLTSGDGRHWD